MHRLLVITTIGIVLATPGSAAAETLALVDLDGQLTGERASGEIAQIDVNRLEVRLQPRGDEPVTIEFVRVAADDLLRILKRWIRGDSASRLSNADAARIRLIMARVAISSHSPGDGKRATAQGWLDGAEGLDPASSPSIAAERLVCREMRADELLTAVTERLAEGQLRDAEKLLDEIEQEYPDSVGAREVTTVRTGILAAREVPVVPPAVEPVDSMASLRLALRLTNQAEQKLREGHENCFHARNSASITPWQEALDSLESAYPATSALAAIDVASEEGTPGHDVVIEDQLRARIHRIRMSLYRSLGHFHLRQGSLTACYDILQRGLEVAPGDPELVKLQVLLRGIYPDSRDG